MSFETVNALFTRFLEDNDSSLLDAWNLQSSELKNLFKKTKAKKDKNAPKKNSSAYIFFCNDKRAEVKDEHPELKNNEILKELGLLWKKYKDEKPTEVKKYEKKAADDKERYQEEMKNYVPSDDVEEQPKEKKTRKKKAAGAPKKGKSAYMFFCADERVKIKEEEPEMPAKDVLAELGNRWKIFKDKNPEAVKKYEKMAADDKVRYEEEMKNYVPVPVEENPVADDKKKTKKKKATGEPKKGKSAYIFFCADERPIVKEENPEMPAKEILAELGARWKKLSDEEKEKYNELAAEDKKRYEEDMKNYVPVEENEEPKENKKAAPKKKKQVKQPEPEPEPEPEKSNEDIVREILDNFEGDTVTKKAIKEELKKRGVEIGKDELNEIIEKLNE
jgi:hypothetical protein